MILLLGTLGDSGIAHLVHRLLDRDIPFLLLDPRDHGRGFTLSWEMEGGQASGAVRHGGRSTLLEAIRAIYVHMLRGRQKGTGTGVAFRTRALLTAFLETTTIPVCNRPSAAATNFSKPFQQQVVALHGFAVPRTLVTNSPEAAAEFFQQCRGRVIFKSVSSVRSIVRRMEETDLKRLKDLAGGPTQFQEWIAGTDVRVHVMGTRVYPTEVSSDATDYRFSGREGLQRTMRGIRLPAEVASNCVSLTAALGMIASGIDLRRGLDGRWYCFEANPTPAFAFYEQFTGQRIADGLIDALLECGASAGNEAPET